MAKHLMSLDAFSTLVDGLDHPEGVAWGPDGYVYAGGEAGQIYRVSLDGGYEQIASTGGFVLGLCLDASANIYACDIGHKAVMRIARNGIATIYSNGTPERLMQNPNYPVFDRHGNLYVSDSGGWLQDNGCVFRIRPGGQAEVVSEQPLQFPNGMALSPDQHYLYIVLSTTQPGVARIALNDDGSVGPLERVVDLPHTVPDGIAFDADKNLYISCYTPNEIYRLTPDGALDTLVGDWQNTMIAGPANMAFCGPDRTTLVVSSLSRWHLACAAMPVAGAPVLYPEL